MPAAFTDESGVYIIRVIRPQTCLPSACALFALMLGCSWAVLGQNAPESQAREAAPQESPEAHLGKGYTDLKNDRYEEAVREFRAALALDPKLVFPARFPLAVALFESQKPEEARKEFETIRSEVGDHPSVMYYLGRLDLTRNDVDRAIRDLTEAAAKPPFPDTAYYLASAYLKKGQLAPAEEWLRKAAALSPQDYHIQERLGVLYREAGRKEEAEKAFALAAELRQRDAEVSEERLACGQKLEKGSPEDARPVCGKLFDPNDAGKLTMLGTIYGEHGDYEEALQPLRRAAELSPKSPQMQYNLALVCFRLKRYEEARASLAGAVRMWPDLFELNALLGVVLYRLGEDASAYQVLSHAHALNPPESETAGLLYKVSLLLAQKSVTDKNYALSLQYLETAAELSPVDPGPHRLMAEVYRLAGQPQRAAEENREVERLSPAATRK